MGARAEGGANGYPGVVKGAPLGHNVYVGGPTKDLCVVDKDGDSRAILSDRVKCRGVRKKRSRNFESLSELQLAYIVRMANMARKSRSEVMGNPCR